MKVAVVHDWLVGMRGGEHVLEAILELFPAAELFTLVYDADAVSDRIQKFNIRTSFLQKIPQITEKYRFFLPVMPVAIELLDLRDYDLVISSSHCVAKGIRKRRGAVHVSYVHAPMRYIWNRYDDYFGPGRASLKVRIAAAIARPFLKWWDKRVSSFHRVNLLVANSRFIAKQIEAAYGRTAQVVYPFAHLERFESKKAKTVDSSNAGYYLVVSAFAPNKRIDLAVAACLQLGRNLKIVGSGQEETFLRQLAAAASQGSKGKALLPLASESNETRKSSPKIEFLGALSDQEITDLYCGCRAFLFPGVDDFGITPVEAMAAGRPVIAFAEGGALETVIPSVTGIFFNEPTVPAFVEALKNFEAREDQFDPEACKKQARKFTREKFKENFKREILAAWKHAGKPENHLTHYWETQKG